MLQNLRYYLYLRKGAVPELVQGLYPIISRNSGNDMPGDNGIILNECTPAEITGAIQQVLQTRDPGLARQISETQRYAGGFFSRENFSGAYSSILDTVLSG